LKAIFIVKYFIEMKKYISSIIILSVIVLIALSFRSSGGKFGPHLSNALDNSSLDHFIVYIYLTDKGPDANLMLSNPGSLITERSIERRLKVKSPDKIVEMTDVPLYQEYVKQLLPDVINLRNQIKGINAVSAEVTRDQLNTIASLNFVKQIELVETAIQKRNDVESNQTYSPPQPTQKEGDNILVDSLNYGTYGTTQITQMNVNLVHDQGIFGQGILIASLDNGFRNQTHPCFINPVNPINIVSQYDFQLHIPGANHTLATHGTTTISCIAAYAPGQLIGTAFKASFLVARTEVDSFERSIEMDNWAAASQWADSLGADIITSSLGYLTFDAGYGPNYSWTDMNGLNMPVTRAAALAAYNGITVFNSAGNNYQNPSHNTLNGPADADSILTLGAVTSSGTVASFSSVGPTTDSPPRIKPDVMAMGSGVQTANGSGSGYSNGGSAGTSYSCPLAAGVGALILSANKDLTPLQVRGILRKFANNTNNPNNTYGWGIINAQLSVDSARKLDNQPPVIQHTPPFSITSNNGVITMKSKITDNGIIRLWQNQSPLLYFRKSTDNGITWSAYSAVTASYINVDSFFFPITGSAAGTRVEYYFAAQDIALPNPLVATLPTGGSGINPPGTTAPPTRFMYTVVTTGISSNNNEVPKQFRLYNNYPNPFNPSTRINFDIASQTNAKLVIYDILGREVMKLIEGNLKPGSYSYELKADNLPSGVYFYRLVTDSFTDTKKMLLIK
jgi:serine protease AprX